MSCAPLAQRASRSRTPAHVHVSALSAGARKLRLRLASTRRTGLFALERDNRRHDRMVLPPRDRSVEIFVLTAEMDTTKMSGQRSFSAILNMLGLLGISSALAVAFYYQLAFGELPCPLCLLQRAG